MFAGAGVLRRPLCDGGRRRRIGACLQRQRSHLRRDDRHPAAQTSSGGISAQAFERHYRPANQDLLSDLPYGRAMRLLTIALARYGLLGAVIRAACHDADVRSALFNAVSAHAPYRQVLGQVLHPRSLLAILHAMFFN